MFEKKFRVRISWFAKKYYAIEYSYSRIIPWYKSINEWFECGVDNNLEHWSTKLFTSKDSEEFAATLKSIEDVNEYYRKENINRTEFYKKKNEFQKNNIPYKSKQIL